MTTRRNLRTKVAALSAGLLAISALTACGANDSGDGGASGDVAAALAKGGDLTIWAWEPTLEKVVADFETAYPNVHVELVNAGTGNDQYTALLNAVSAGSGVPDIAQIEYYALPQFALTDSLSPLGGFGADGLEGTFSPGPWGSVHQGDAVYGLPMDSGPMALFYNKTVFDKHHIAVPATWTEYVDAARKLHAADPDAYITSDSGDAGFTTSLIWQAGGRPFQVDGTNVTINLADAGSTRFAQTWQPLIDEKLLSPVSGWTDAWYKGLADGTIATLVTGAWMPANFTSGVAGASGDWRVAPMPQWDAGGTVTAENGGSSLTITKAAANKALAYGFMQYATTGPGVKTRLTQGAFPATTADLDSPEFLATEFEYFGGQKANEILAASAKNVARGWSYLPFQVYANSVFNDTVGQAYVSGTPLTEGLKAWQDSCVAYGNDQGFTVKG